MDTAASKAHYFEGVEKLLEIWFAESADNAADMRSISRPTWEELLKAVHCEIISCTKNDCIDAYVLSESSMFVSQRRWILKTCGTTTPLACLKPVLKLAAQLGLTEVTDLFYSRKNFARPEVQRAPYQGFCDEVDFLDSIFENGRSYCLGSINRECWYLYTFSKKCSEQADNESNNMIMSATECANEPDQTIEILMQDLSPEIMSIFTQDVCSSAKEATEKSHIDKILPNMLIDDFLFDPCGYSMNGIGKHGEYMTIHITPEKEFSYVSFESNVATRNYTTLINRVIKTFQPAKFIVTIFANKESEAYATLKDLELEYSKLANWNRADMQCCNFPSYNLLFAQYSHNCC